MPVPGRMLPIALVTGVLAVACAQPPAPPAAPRSEPPLLTAPAPLRLRSDAPQRYTVQPGDTLWEIAGRYLEQPWRWPEIWQANPQLRNPHLIYPGNVLELYYERTGPGTGATAARGRPRVRVQPGAGGTVRLSPQIRVEALNDAVPTVPRDAVAGFLRQAVVTGSDDWGSMPYLLASPDDRFTLIAGDLVYARGLGSGRRNWHIVRPSGEYLDPDSGASLGFYAIDVGDAELQAGGDPATLRITSARREVRPGDRLMPAEAEESRFYFTPKPVPAGTDGRIVAMFEGLGRIGQYQTAVLNLGSANGIEVGHVLNASVGGRAIQDPYSRDEDPTVQLPDLPSATLMVYRVFGNVSYALVMHARRPISVGDRVGPPAP